MNFVLMHQSIVDRDAIGKDIIEMYRILSRHHRCHLYCDYLTGCDDCQRIDSAEMEGLLARSDTVVIYHHSYYWERGETLLNACKGRLIFKYHNITPPDYFADFPCYWRGCLLGREQTYRLVRSFPNALWMADSEFNLSELGLTRLPVKAVVPPFMESNEPSGVQPDPETLDSLVADRHVKALFIGRFVPNKGHLMLIRVLEAYKKLYGEDLTLYIIGKLDPVFEPYHTSVMEESRVRGVLSMVNWIGSVDDRQRLSYYLGCDVYLSCSDHEGFGVPLIEAQALGLPVAAKGISAVPDTVGAGQMLFGTDPTEYAEAIRRVVSDRDYRAMVLRIGARNYQQRFRYENIARQFVDAVSTYVGEDI